MEQKDINIPSYVRSDGVAVRPHTRRQWFSRKNKNIDSKQSLNTLVAEPSEPKPIMSDEEFKAVEEREKAKRSRIRELADKIFSAPAIAIWGAGNLAAGVANLTIGVAGVGALAASLWFAIPVVAYMAAKPLMEGYFRRRTKKASREVAAATPRVSQQYLEKAYAELGGPPQEATLHWGKEKKSAKKSQELASGLHLHSDRTATLNYYSKWMSLDEHNDTYPIMRTIQLYPKASFKGRDLSDTDFKASGADLRGADFSGSAFWTGSFRASIMTGANFQGVSTEDVDFSKADLRNANFKKANLAQSSFSRAYLTGASFDGAIIYDLRRANINLSDEQMMSLDPLSFERCRVYDQITFDSAVEDLGIPEKQFEFLVLSGALEVRDNETCKPVTSDFDPGKHHVTRWDLIKAKRTLQTE